MMDFIFVPIIVGTITLGVYGVFELLIRRKERLKLIEKITENKISPDMIGSRITMQAPNISSTPFGALKIAAVLSGLGIGIIVGHCIGTSMMLPQDEYFYRKTYELIIGASALACSGLGLIIAFIIELKMSRNK